MRKAAGHGFPDEANGRHGRNVEVITGWDPHIGAEAPHALQRAVANRSRIVIMDR